MSTAKSFPANVASSLSNILSIWSRNCCEFTCIHKQANEFTKAAILSFCSRKVVHKLNNANLDADAETLLHEILTRDREVLLEQGNRKDWDTHIVIWATETGEILVRPTPIFLLLTTTIAIIRRVSTGGTSSNNAPSPWWKIYKLVHVPQLTLSGGNPLGNSRVWKPTKGKALPCEPEATSGAALGMIKTATIQGGENALRKERRWICHVASSSSSIILGAAGSYSRCSCCAPPLLQFLFDLELPLCVIRTGLQLRRD